MYVVRNYTKPRGIINIYIMIRNGIIRNPIPLYAKQSAASLSFTMGGKGEPYLSAAPKIRDNTRFIINSIPIIINVLGSEEETDEGTTRATEGTDGTDGTEEVIGAWFILL